MDGRRSFPQRCSLHPIPAHIPFSSPADRGLLGGLGGGTVYGNALMKSGWEAGGWLWKEPLLEYPSLSSLTLPVFLSLFLMSSKPGCETDGATQLPVGLEPGPGGDSSHPVLSMEIESEILRTSEVEREGSRGSSSLMIA